MLANDRLKQPDGISYSIASLEGFLASVPRQTRCESPCQNFIMYGDFIMYCVIDAAFLALEGRQGDIKVAVVTISRREESLRHPCVPPAAEWSDKSGQVAIGWVQRYAVLAVSGICDCFPRVWGYDVQDERSLHSEFLMFSCDQHSVAPCHRLAVWHAFNDT